jgi:hypothetical protein
LCHLQHKLISFYNRDGKCLQRGTDWGFRTSVVGGTNVQLLDVKTVGASRNHKVYMMHLR